MLFTLIGITGVVINLAAYGLLSAGKLRGEDVRYQLLNIAGTLGILLSLLAQWNMAVLVTNLAWLAVGVVGLLRILKRRRHA